MPARSLTIKLEQYRQAKRIHGGFLNLCIAALGVKLARLPIPSKRLRASLFRTIFEKKYGGLDEQEAEQPLWAYRSLNAVFTRGVKPEFRAIPSGTPQFLSPCDGTVQDVGPIQQDRLVTLKGIEYTLDSLLPHTDTAALRGRALRHCLPVADRLSPHLQSAGRAPGRSHSRSRLPAPGSSALSAAGVSGLHPERADDPRFSTPLGPCLLVMVAGWGVGNITLPLDPSFRPASRTAASKTWKPPLAVQTGRLGRHF